MICLLLIMTIIFVNSPARAEQKVRHSDTLFKEEDMNAKTKAWLLMVESGKVDEEELRRITPKSIFIAPLLTSRTGKCKEGYRHDHLGQCVKVIKIDPQVQLQLLLQKLNRLYSEKKEVEKEEKTEFFEVSNGPLHFSLPISAIGEKTTTNKTNNDTDWEDRPVSMVNNSTPKTENSPKFIPIPFPILYLNQTNQTKEIESSGTEPLNDKEEYDTSQIEGSGDEQTALRDDFLEEETTTESSISLLSEETDYFEVTEAESIAALENHSTTEPPVDEFTSAKGILEVFKEESYQNKSNTLSVNDSTAVLPKEKINVQKEIIVKSSLKSDKIHFPSDDDEDHYFESLRTPPSSLESSRIRFPDEMSQFQVNSYRSQPSLNTNTTKNRSNFSSTIPRERFWWLPKNWHIDESQQKPSTLMKVWSRLPLMHDITYSRETPFGFKKSAFSNEPQVQSFTPQNNEGFSESYNHQRRSHSETVKPFTRSRFQEVILTPMQNSRLQR